MKSGEIRPGLIVVQPTGEWCSFDMSPLIVGWPSVNAWIEALPVTPAALAEGGTRTVQLDAPGGGPRAYVLTPMPGDDCNGRAVRVEPVEAAPAQWLRAALDMVDDSVWSIDTEMRLTACNRAFREAYFETRGGHLTIGRYLPDYALSDDLAAFWVDIYRRALGGEWVRDDLDETVLKTQRPRLMKLSACPIRLDGAVVGVACFLRDHTDARAQARALERQNALLDALARVQSRFIGEGQSVSVYNELLEVVLELTGSPFGLLGETRRGDDGRPALVVTAVSDVSWDEASRVRYMGALTGQMRFDDLDSLLGSVLTSEAPVISNDPARDSRAGGVPLGHFTLESFMGLPCHVGNRLVGMVGVANRPGGYDRSLVAFLQPLLRAFGTIIEARHNEHRRQAAELALQRAKEAAEKADRAKGQFLASMSHEIRTPLNAVLGLCELALDAAVDADQKSLLKSARTNSETLLNLISDILDFSRIDAGRIELDHAPFDLRRLVEEVAETMALRAAPEGVAVVAAVQPVIPSPLMGDAHRVRQVLTNLAANAVKYTHEGEVRIEVSVERADGGAAVHIEVVDTGLGIPAHEHERIFERFHRVAATAGVGGGGTGLGLSITKILVDHMDGRIAVDSEVGRGSRFIVDLPLGLAPETLDDGPPAFLLDEVRVAVVHPPRGDGPQIVRLLEAFGARVQRFDAVDDVDLEQVDVLLTVTPVTAVEPPVVRLASVGSLNRAGDEPWRLTLPARRDALLDVVIAASGLDRALDRSPSLHPLPEVTHCQVLLVEDHPDNRAVARRHLERHGHLVDVAEHGGIAIEKARETAYDLVLMDLHMPHVDGIDATRAIRVDEARMGVRPVPIVAVTAHATSEVRQRCFEIGFDGFVPKPVSGGILIETVERFALHDPVALIVDDAPDSLRLLTRHLRRELPMRLRLADDGASARALVAKSPPTLALVDATLPDESGFDLAAWIRETVGEAATIIMVTGRTDAEARRLAQSAGCDGFVTKPVNRRQLLSEIDAHMRRTQRSTASRAARERAAPTGSSIASGASEEDPAPLLGPVSSAPAPVEADGRDAASMASRGDDSLAQEAGVGVSEVTEPEGRALEPPSARPRSVDDPGTAPALALRPQNTEPMPQLGSELPDLFEGRGPVLRSTSAPPVEVAYVDPDLLDLIPPFLQDRRDDLAAIAVALERDDMTTIARLGHSMKGNGRAYGMPHVSALGRRIEQAAREGDLSGLRSACAELSVYVETVHVLPGD